MLLDGVIEFEADAPAQRILDAIAARRVAAPMTAWQCCLECYAVATRLPPEFRLPPADAARLIEAEVLGRFTIHALPDAQAATFLRTSAEDRIAGGRIYDAHIAENRPRGRRASRDYR